jgi:hypothetical protein
MFLRSFSADPSSILLEIETMSHFPTAYVDEPELEKLSELRAKTERQVEHHSFQTRPRIAFRGPGRADLLGRKARSC